MLLLFPIDPPPNQQFKYEVVSSMSQSEARADIDLPIGISIHIRNDE